MAMVYRFLLLLLILTLPAHADPPRVIASVQPLHSLVAGVMRGVGEPALLLQGGASPHDHQLRPSDLRLLNDADKVFWFGEALEPFLEKPLHALAAGRAVALLDAPGLTLLPRREGGVWGEDHAEDHALGHGGHEHEADLDPHVWLDPVNAKALIQTVGAELSAVDPANAAVYQANVAELSARLDALTRTLDAGLAAVRDRPYVVFHDAYQYFENRFGTNALGSLTLNPELQPGARRVQAVRDKIIASQARCVFSEPQFRPTLVATLLQDTGAKSGVLDPLGADLQPGPDAYFQLLDNLAAGLRDCLGGT